ncbi:hypothetical protein G3A_07045 [Bacillus sp. 17376]|uniref:Mobile element protein n=1 Tax=Mesobacillus boroniphilus JCM 21738 TaxID=1294265 RepID=W4RP45_9BACI|nr:tyrosine-type recombinase/integrase [Mesobacillus boroniphilus]ESU33269.1 hypothetical protein G3A_07045 [Bacillus sp. 17376]GAE46200.1 mobile element protein [Mesobacillus boroniphilus JCM 21738]
MRVQEIILEGNKKRYMLLDGVGKPVIPVMQYLKFLDTGGKSGNTQKTYCYSLKLYFEFLQENRKEYIDVKLEDFIEFVAWLRNPYGATKISPIEKVSSVRTERTVNLTITAVTNFYDFLHRNEALDKNVVDRLFKQVFPGGKRKYKDFLFHVNKGKSSSRNIIKIKVPRRKVEVLTKQEVELLIEATSNIRDKFLLQLLFETGLRIGEALSLFIEDFKIDHKKGNRIHLVNRGELENGAKLKTGERNIFVSQALMDLYDDYLYEVLDDLNTATNFLFVKLRGDKMGQAMNYMDVSALFKRLKKKTGINVHPHLFRHTHATIFFKETKDIKQVQERLGHSQIQTTMNLYLHPSTEEIRENWERSQHAFKINSLKQQGDSHDTKS